MQRLSHRSLLPALLLLMTGPAFAQPVEPDGPAELQARPGYREPVAGAHPSYTVESARPEGFEPQVGAIAFSPDGKFLAVTSFPPLNGFNIHPNGTLYILENPTATDPSQIIVHEIAKTTYHPLGAHWNEDGLFILDRDQITKWTDTNDDGIPDDFRTFASGWKSDNFHSFSFGLPYHDGYFYGALSTNLHLSRRERATLVAGEGIAGRINERDRNTIGGNAPNPAHRGCIMKVDAKTGEIEWIAGGLRTPNGIGIGPDGVVLAPDNQGDWKPSNGIYAVRGGEFLGKYNCTASTSFYPDGGVPSLFSEKEPTPPAVWLAQNEIGNSPAQILLIPEGQPYAGHLLIADNTQGGVHRIYMEEVNGVWQGTAFRHSMGFEAGPHRLAWGPDGCLYVGSMGQGSANWGWNLTKFGLERMRPTGQTVFEYSKIETTAKGFRVSFTRPVPASQLGDPSQWLIDAWTYVPMPFYGGRKREAYKVTPSQVIVAEDRTSVELVVEDRRPNFVYHIRIDAVSDDGEKMWSPEAWVTFHNAPSE
ncbi:MAG: hypothetical protein AAGH88_04920 [Planctomycetota bacterium]